MYDFPVNRQRLINSLVATFDDIEVLDEVRDCQLMIDEVRGEIGADDCSPYTRQLNPPTDDEIIERVFYGSVHKARRWGLRELRLVDEAVDTGYTDAPFWEKVEGRVGEKQAALARQAMLMEAIDECSSTLGKHRL